MEIKMSDKKKNDIDTGALMKKLIDGFAESDSRKEDAKSPVSGQEKAKEDAELEALLSGILQDAEKKEKTSKEEIDLPWDTEEDENTEKTVKAESIPEQKAKEETEPAKDVPVPEATVNAPAVPSEPEGKSEKEPEEHPENEAETEEPAPFFETEEPVRVVNVSVSQEENARKQDKISKEQEEESLWAEERPEETPRAEEILTDAFEEEEEPADTGEALTASEPEVKSSREEEPAKEKSWFVSMDAKLMYIFGNHEGLQDVLDPEQMKKMENEIEGTAKGRGVKEEYTSPDQNLRFFKRFRTGYIRLTVRTLLAVIALAAVAVLEVGSSFGPGIFVSFGEKVTNFLSNPTFEALIAMRITMFLLAIGYKEVLAGLRAICGGRSVPELFVAITAAATLLYELGLIFCHSIYATFYNLPLAVLIFLTLLFERADLKRKLYAFNIISSRRPKLAIGHRQKSESAPECAAFAGHMNGGTGIFKISKTQFISGYGKRTAKEPKYKDIIGVFAAVTVVAAIAFFLVGYFTASQTKLLSGCTSAMLAVLFCLPMSAFISYSLPFFKASERAFRMDSAIIGEYTLEEYSSADVISFNDVDIFPSKNIKVRSLRLYRDARIDHVLYGAASLFGRLGGPLAEVFAAATGETGFTEDVDILEIEPDGVEALVKGVNVCAGRSAFMRKRGLLGTVDPGDEELEMQGRVSVMYLAIKNEVCARMQIEYTPDPEFKDIMRSLYKAGMCVGIRTLDPNIDNRMLSGHADLLKYPIKILRMECTEEQKVEEEMESGVVSKRSVKDLLKTLASCRKVLQVIRTDTIIKIVSVICGIAAMIFLTVAVATGQMAGIYEVHSLWVTLYQLCWIIPVLIISLIFA